MQKKNEKKVAILAVLKEQARPFSAARIAELLSLGGHAFSERTVRFYLKELDSEGLTIPHGKKGRSITKAGLAELRSTVTRQLPG